MDSVTNSKLVSVIAPCYNGAKYLPAFLESLIEQTYRPIEFHFINDGSTDSTLNVFDAYRERIEASGISLKYYYQNNAGQAAAINTALPHINGSFIMWVDSDDILLPENISKKVDYLSRNPDIGFVFCEGEIVDSKDVNTPVGKLTRHIDGKCNSKKLFIDLLMERNVIFGPGTIMVNRHDFIKAIPSLHIYEGRQGQNFQLLLPLAYCCKYGIIKETLFKYVVHDDSHSHKKRSYAKLIERNNVLIDLIKNTIEGIPMISEEEKKYYFALTEKKYLRKNLELSLCYHKPFRVCNYRRKLRNYDVTSIMFYYPIYIFYRTIQKATRIIRSSTAK